MTGWKIHHLKMYFLLNMWIFDNIMLVFRVCNPSLNKFVPQSPRIFPPGNGITVALEEVGAAGTIGQGAEKYWRHKGRKMQTG